MRWFFQILKLFKILQGLSSLYSFYQFDSDRVYPSILGDGEKLIVPNLGRDTLPTRQLGATQVTKLLHR